MVDHMQRDAHDILTNSTSKSNRHDGQRLVSTGKEDDNTTWTLSAQTRWCRCREIWLVRFESRVGPTVPLGELRALTETLGWEREMTLALWPSAKVRRHKNAHYYQRQSMQKKNVMSCGIGCQKLKMLGNRGMDGGLSCEDLKNTLSPPRLKVPGTSSLFPMTCFIKAPILGCLSLSDESEAQKWHT